MAKGGGRLNVLSNECGISQAFDPTSGDKSAIKIQFVAIWDTGATKSVVTQKVVDACGLLPTGMAKVQGVSGSSVAETYLVNIKLPNNVECANIRVTKGDLGSFGADVLIGMDIINRGDFAVTNKGGATKFSFRVPSQTHIDFVAEHNAAANKTSSSGQKQHKRRPKKPKRYGKQKRSK